MRKEEIKIKLKYLKWSSRLKKKIKLKNFILTFLRQAGTLMQLSFLKVIPKTLMDDGEILYKWIKCSNLINTCTWSDVSL